MKKLFLALLAGTLLFTSCEEDEVRDFVNNTLNTGLTDEEINEGLKEALSEGTDSSSSELSQENGYFLDETVKILLPEDLQNTINTFKSQTIELTSPIPLVGSLSLTGEQLYNGYKNTTFGIDIPGIKDKEDALIQGLNAAAEAAASTAGPIFKDAITGMTVTDGLSILNGPDNSATLYLKNNTYDDLFTTYEPIVDAKLAEVKVGGKSVDQLYSEYVNAYNDILNTSLVGISVSSLVNMNTIDATDLSQHGTEKALDGLFLKVSEEEKEIRENPFAYASDVIQKVFGSVL